MGDGGGEGGPTRKDIWAFIMTSVDLVLGQELETPGDRVLLFCCYNGSSLPQKATG